MSKLKPMHDYLLIEVLKPESTIIKSGDIRDSLFLGRKGKVVAVGPGVWNQAGTELIKPSAKVGDIVYWEEAAEANTPEELRKDRLALMKDARLMAKETK